MLSVCVCVCVCAFGRCFVVVFVSVLCHVGVVAFEAAALEGFGGVLWVLVWVWEVITQISNRNNQHNSTIPEGHLLIAHLLGCPVQGVSLGKSTLTPTTLITCKNRGKLGIPSIPNNR